MPLSRSAIYASYQEKFSGGVALAKESRNSGHGLVAFVDALRKANDPDCQDSALDIENEIVLDLDNL